MPYSELANWDGSMTRAKSSGQLRLCGPAISTRETETKQTNKESPEAETPASASSSIQLVNDLLEMSEQSQAASTLSVSNSLEDELFPEARTYRAPNKSSSTSFSTNPHPLPTPPTPPPEVIHTVKKKGRRTPNGSTAHIRNHANVDDQSTPPKDSNKQSGYPPSRNASFFIELPTLESLGHSRDSYRSLESWYSEGRCKEFFHEKVLSSASVQGSSKIPDDSEQTVVDDGASTDTESYLELLALDAICHQCRRKNCYAKMKCSNIRAKGDVCRLEYCHHCIYYRYPNIVFEHLARNFVCPRCQGNCNCTICCEKRNEIYRKTRKKDFPQVSLYLSDLGQRQLNDRQRTANKGILQKSKPVIGNRQKTKRFKSKTEIGQEAEEWISAHLADFAPSGSKRRLPRVFVGDWQEGWGRLASNPASVSMICVDVPVVEPSDPAGKGKGRALEPQTRLFVGDPNYLRKSFLHARDVKVPIDTKPARRKKSSAKARKSTIPQSIKKGRKKRAKGEEHSIPDFTDNITGGGIDPFRSFDPFLGNQETAWGEETQDDLQSGFDWERQLPLSPMKGLDDTYFDEQYRAAYNHYGVLSPVQTYHNNAFVQHTGFDASVYNLEPRPYLSDFDSATHVTENPPPKATPPPPSPKIDPSLLALPMTLSSPMMPTFMGMSATPLQPTLLPGEVGILSGPSEDILSPQVLSRDSDIVRQPLKNVKLTDEQVEYAIRQAFWAILH